MIQGESCIKMTTLSRCFIKNKSVKLTLTDMLVHKAAGTQDKIALGFKSPLPQVTPWLVLICSLACFYFLHTGSVLNKPNKNTEKWQRRLTILCSFQTTFAKVNTHTICKKATKLYIVPHNIRQNKIGVLTKWSKTSPKQFRKSM